MKSPITNGLSSTIASAPRRSVRTFCTASATATPVIPGAAGDVLLHPEVDRRVHPHCDLERHGDQRRVLERAARAGGEAQGAQRDGEGEPDEQEGPRAAQQLD